MKRLLVALYIASYALLIPSVAFLPVIAIAQVSVDNTRNGAIATVSGAYDAAAVTINVVGGHGARLPIPPFRCVWWNTTDYTRAFLDPKVEVVRVTAVSTDALTATRGISGESTSAQTHNISGKVYQLDCGLTAGLFAALAAGAAPSGGDINSSGNVVTLHLGSPLSVAQGGLGQASLAAHGIILGNGTSAPNVTSPGTAAFVYTSNGPSLDGTFQVIPPTSLVTGVTGNLPVTRLNGGLLATLTSFWRGDGVWSTLGGIPYTETTVTTSSIIADYGGAWNFDCAAACTQTLPTVVSQTGSTEQLCVNDTSAPVTIDPNGAQTINGSATRIMVAGECANIVVRSGEWKKISGRSVHLSAIVARATTQAIVANTWTVVPMPLQTGGDAVMYDSVNSRISILRPGIYAITVNIATDTPTTAQQIGTGRNTSLPDYNAGPFGATSDPNTRLFFSNPSIPLVAGDYINAAFYIATTGVTVLGGGVNIVEMNPW